MRRRDLLFSGAALPALAWGSQGRPAASDRVTLGVIGCGNQGTNDLFGFLRDERVQVVAVCDVNRESAGYWDGRLAGREPARHIVEWNYAREKRSGLYKGCAAYDDFRKLIARDDIDAVLLALPDHWHAIPTVAAAKAKKHIYGEKPLSLTVADGRAMVNAVKASGVVFQTGSQQRSDARFRKACELVRNGRLGRLTTVRCGLPGGTPDFGRTGHRKEPEPVPEGFLYDFWLGPAPEAPYSPARCHVNYRWNLDYSGGQITDWGGHHPDIAHWAMGMDASGPVAIRNAKGVFASDKVWNTATEFYFEAVYANGVTMIVSHRERGGVTFEGTEGKVWVNRGAIEAEPKSLLDVEFGAGDVRLYESKDHFRNFVDCVLTKKEPVAPIEAAHRSITVAHLGNIALKLGRDLRWDAQKERFAGDEAADRMLSRPLRAPWKLA
ncbi:MAG TPA: gfo/Idh/MocA family oxidoreductase [Solibacterales bacterium]|nr:gfo/Idh/MocA family oxidoreductase [Bryobacterales bacterium]